MKKIFLLLISFMLSLVLFACANTNTQEETNKTVDNTTENNTVATDSSLPTEDNITINETLTSSTDGQHVIETDGTVETYSNIKVEKTGDSSGDEADFYGENAAVFATNGATLTLDNIVVETNGTHANGVFSYGSGTTVNISNSVINTSNDCSGGIMTTGGGTMNATNLNVHTTGRSSAAIRSDRGGGTVNVTGGSYVTDGKGSPAIYSTADITVSDAYLESTTSQGVVVEGKNSVTLNNVELVANNTAKNSDKSDTFQAVMIYQSMSGDADEGLASFAMTNGSILNKNGDIFFVNNTVANIDLENVTITNEDTSGVFLRAEAAGWGSEGSNGGQVTMNLKNQTATGDMLVDSISTLNLYLKNNSSYTGAINSTNSGGQIYVEIEDGSTWTLTEDSYITSLTCGTNAIKLNGHKLYVNGVEYTEGSASTGDTIAIVVTTSSNSSRPEMPSGAPNGGSKPESGKEPPAKPNENKNNS